MRYLFLGIAELAQVGWLHEATKTDVLSHGLASVFPAYWKNSPSLSRDDLSIRGAVATVSISPIRAEAHALKALGCLHRIGRPRR